ncbi:MAG: glycosyltransferase [Chitinophagaceae bacterium]|nr:glycosyltransferase [Chitinophagaceae bacterium]
MKILFIVDWYYPGYKAGGPIQSCVNIVKLLKVDFDFYVLTSDRDHGSALPYPGIFACKWQTGPNGESVFYCPGNKMNLALIRRIIEEIQPELIYFNSMFSFRFTAFPLIALKLINYKGKILLAPRGMLHKGALSLKSFKKKSFLKAVNISNIFKRVHFHATDDQEGQDILRYFKKNKVNIVQNIPDINIPFVDSSKQKGLLRLLFISRIHPKKNLSYILNVLNSGPFTGAIKFDIYGDSESDDYLGKCRHIVSNLPSNIEVNFMNGVVHDEIVKLFSKYDAFVLPSLGENFGHVIFESLMSGTPVLISDQTPWQRLVDYNAGWSIPLDDFESYKVAIQNLINLDLGEHRKLSLGSRKLAEEYLANADFKRKYFELFKIV